ncbi:MAG: adenine phosphoribosyltransferase [Erysipelotrichaceae bacterium]|jgi:adenine phosphoribosyltransferase|nr:adenine phosphoribosyltransferase [Erysipelotrichaceae bacterium]MBQ1322818.1 adenine phosphoribosyltransferase [Erysipelotrichaceae bacterium]MBQ1346771.1 adenine phosphoribosyltransferase [Erysipelotrichaceae bacterium]MBQ1740122.1 adenine phosphoribosyltransferase [Erysipelotrichaceae bacterium]MBQ1812100.1 adenine phosphoribosyltransferase [Erysipelotrichaceae bacterium]
MNLKDYVASIPDFPQEGILFRDITPLMADGEAFHYACEELIDYAKKVGAQVVAGPESRGFIFGCPVAHEMKIGFVPVRKPNKLPRKTISYKYDLEYGSNELHMHADAIKPGQKVLIIDDLLATGGTVEATAKMIEELGGEVVGCAFLIELEGLGGREKLDKYDVFTLMKY